MGAFYIAMDKRVNVYVDGFNLYYGLKSKKWKKYYWIDIVRFFEQFIKPNQVLEQVYYFTAVPKNTIKKDRQDLFFSANKLNPKFKLIFGKYLEKTVRYCGQEFKTYEEKQTDVNIAVEMIRNVVFNKCDISILVSADSDLLPPINLLRELSPEHKIFVFFPPNRYSTDLANHCDNSINLLRYEQRFKKAIMEEEIQLPNGYIIKKPSTWK